LTKKVDTHKLARFSPIVHNTTNTMPSPPTTPTTEQVWPQQQQPTPQRARIQGTIDYFRARGIKGRTADVFRFNGVTHATGYRILKRNSRTLHNDNSLEESRGRKSLISKDKLKEMEYILETEGIAARAMTWQQLGLEVGLDVSGRTIQRALGSLEYSKCIACQRGWVNAKTAVRRLEWAKFMLNRYPSAEDWKRVRFSDEVHFGYGPQGKLRIIRKPGQRCCPDCIQEQNEPEEKDRKRMHCWAAIGFDFKSDIYFYTVPGNTNGKMTQSVYINQILEPIVKPWIEAGHDFALEEDGDSGHGPAHNNNIVRKWKETHGLEYYFNCASSPDLSPIENCWQPAKQHLRKFPHWDDATTIELIREGWDRVSQEFINKRDYQCLIDYEQ
jgi:transposase